MLTLENLEIQLGGFSLTADFTVPTSARLSILGPSGAGKSTLLSAIAGFLSPKSGRILWGKTDLEGQEPGDRPISTLFQDNNLFPHLTAAQNVGLGVRPSLRLTDTELDQVRLALKQVGLDGFENRKPQTLSGGQQSRVALARMLVQDNPLIMLDEPFSALGPGLRAEMLDLVIELTTKRAATVLMVTHDIQDASQFDGMTVFVDENVALAPVKTETLLSNPTAALEKYLAT